MKLLDSRKLGDFAAALVSAGYRVIAPVAEGGVVRLAQWKKGMPIRTDAIPVNSVKDALLPASEVIGRYAFQGNDFALKDARPDAPKTVVLCARPCDAASLAAMDTVFNWDYKDEFYNARRDATTVVTLACASCDDQCFCTSVGGAPDSTAGADAILRPAEDAQTLIFEPLSEKGRALADLGSGARGALGGVLVEGQALPRPPADVPVRFDPRLVADWCRENFDSPLWVDLSLACLGCGACAYACPTCHCFDIQDESTRREGVRLRNWDSCGLALFTLHSSGHNPRSQQAARWRQRVMHKFSYFPERFRLIACTGCGRCGRLCPAGVAISEVCQRIERACKAGTK